MFGPVDDTTKKQILTGKQQLKELQKNCVIFKTYLFMHIIALNDFNQVFPMHSNVRYTFLFISLS